MPHTRRHSCAPLQLSCWYIATAWICHTCLRHNKSSAAGCSIGQRGAACQLASPSHIGRRRPVQAAVHAVGRRRHHAARVQRRGRHGVRILDVSPKGCGPANASPRTIAAASPKIIEPHGSTEPAAAALLEALHPCSAVVAVLAAVGAASCRATFWEATDGAAVKTACNGESRSA